MTRQKTFLILLSAFLFFMATIITIYDQWQLSLQRAKAQLPKLAARELEYTAYNTFKIPKRGLIHIGAHHAEELEKYKSLQLKDILWIEADPNLKGSLIQRTKQDPYSKVAIFAASNISGTAEFYVTNNEGMSSSMLRLKKHFLTFPEVAVAKKITVQQETLDNYLKNHPELSNINYNFIVIDVQGGEKLALSGARNTLRNIDAIIAEVNYEELYENAVLLHDLDDFLLEHNFLRVDTESVNPSYGNALYVKNSFCCHAKK